MVRARALIRRCLTPAVAAGLLGGLVAVVPAAPAAAATSITVTPSSNLVQGQTISVSGTGYPANSPVGIIECAAGAQTISDCEFRYTTTTTDASGSFTNGTFTVHQVIDAGAHGILDCAVDACVIAVGTFPDQMNVALAPITMTNTLGPPDYPFVLNGPYYLDAGDRVTVAANLTCNTSGLVFVDFKVMQGGNLVRSPSSTGVACVAGDTVHVVSDYLPANFSPGPMNVVVSTTSGAYPTTAKADVTLLSTADAQAALVAQLQGPNGAQVFTQLITDLKFRILHNPIFAHEFYVAILQAMAAG